MPRPSDRQVIILDTTLRDGEMTPRVNMNVQDKLNIALVLEAMGVDVIEVGYPGRYPKDFEEIVAVSKQVTQSTICGLAGANESEITAIAQALRSATRARIHTYTNVNLNPCDRVDQQQALTTIKTSVTLARNYCEDVEWSAFDATRSDTDFLCKAIETAIDSGATTINIPDSLGVASPAEFSQLIDLIINRVPTIDRAVISVHCHEDLGNAVANSLAALSRGARQVECSINGLGARKGNADLSELLQAITTQTNYSVPIDCTLMERASKLVHQLTKT